MSFAWLASYPKSGNTWMRALLTNYLSREAQPADINEMIARDIAASQQLVEEILCLEITELTAAEIEHYRPLAYRCLGEDSVYPYFVKIHDAFEYNADGEALFPAARAIYLLRNPLDVATSFAHHSAISVDECIRRMNEGFTMDLGPEGAGHFPQRLLTWSGHVRSWLDQAEVDVLPVRYEDLHQDTRNTFAKVVDFLQLEFDEHCLEQAVEFSRFSILRRQESESGFREKQSTAASFFRKGATGRWQQELSPAQVQAIIDSHADVMQRFGYLADTEGFLATQ